MDMKKVWFMHEGARRLRKSGVWIGLLAGAIALSGCASAGAGAPMQASFVLSEDVRADIQSMESPMLDGQLLPLDEEIQHSDILSIKNDTMLFNKKQGLYSVNIEDETSNPPIPILNQSAIAVSEDGRKALYERESALYIHDIASGESKKLQVNSSDFTSLQFGDREGRFVVIPIEVGVIAIVDTATNDVQTLRLENYIQSKTYGYSHDFQVHQGEFYIPLSIGQGQNDNLYKINLDNDQFEPVLVNDHMYLADYQVLSNGTILFDGQYQDEDGVFIYDPTSGTSTSLISEKDTDEGRITYAFSLSPDESRILIEDIGNNDVSIAELKDGKLVNKRSILQGYSLTALIWMLTSWNEDGNDVYIELSYEDGSSSIGAVSNIVKFKSEQ